MPATTDGWEVYTGAATAQREAALAARAEKEQEPFPLAQPDPSDDDSTPGKQPPVQEARSKAVMDHGR